MLWLSFAGTVNASTPQPLPSGCISGTTITKRHTIGKGAVYRCSHAMLSITKNGGWDVHDGGTLALDDVNITLTKNKAGAKTSGLMITLHPGATLMINNSVVRASLATPIKKTSMHDGRAKRFLIKSLQQQANKTTHITLKNNQFSAATPRTLGLVLLYDWDLLTTDDFSKVSQSDGNVTGDFSDNTITGFTGGFIGFHLNHFTIRNNVFERNYGGNIGISGSNITVDTNTILYPGNGGDGDGISAISYLEDARITNNTIRNGSCYGMWLRLGKSSNILIENNTVAGGITGGIYFSESPFQPKGSQSNIRVQKNLLIANKGFGIGVDTNMSGIHLEKNFLRDNHPNNEEDIAISKTATVSLKKNVILNQTLNPNHPEQTTTPAKILYF